MANKLLILGLFGAQVSKPMPIKQKRNSIGNPEDPKRKQVHTILESWSWRKERRGEAAVLRQSGPEPCSETPSYLSRASDVTYVNRADQMTSWCIFNFLRAHGEERGRSRPLEGDGDIFRRRNDCQDSSSCLSGLEN